MSALRTVHRAAVWSKSEYVCLCCRRRLLARGQQERTFSDTTTTTQIDDDWYSNFNNLYDEPLTKKRGDVKTEPLAKDELASGKKKTRRQRIAGDSFSDLKLSLSSRLRTPPPAEPTQDQNGDQGGKANQVGNAHQVENGDQAENGNQTEIIIQPERSGYSTSYQPFPRVSSSSADPGLFSELQTNLQRAIRKESSRRVGRGEPAVDVYQPSAVAPPDTSGRPRDPQLEAVIQELSAVWSIKTVQMIQDLQRKREEAKRTEFLNGSKLQHTIDPAIQMQQQPDSASSPQHTQERAQPMYRYYPALDNPWRPPKTVSVDHVPGTVNESIEKHEPDPATTVLSSVIAEVPDSARQIMPPPTMSSLLNDLAETRSRIVQTGEEGFRASGPTYRTVFNEGPNSAQGEQVDASLPSVRKTESKPLRPIIRPLLKDKDPAARNQSSIRAMSSMTQKATELLNDISSSKDAIPPWGIGVSKADPNVDNEVLPSANASQILGTLHPKGKQTKSPRASKKEKKAKKEPGKKSKRALSGDNSKKDAVSKKSQTRRARSRAKVRKLVTAGVAVRKLLVPSDHSSKTAKAESESLEPTLKTRRSSVPRATETEVADTSTSAAVKDEEGETRPELHPLQPALSALDASDVVSINPSSLEITPLNISQPPVPGLQHGLDRVLFNPGVFQLQDPHSRVFNFDPYLQKIMPVVEFDYNALKQYKTSSQDRALSDLAMEHGKRYIGSTSSMTGTLGHFHYLISNFRPLNLKMLSRSFPDSLESFTQINRAPNAIFLRNKGDGIYAIDADKEFDGPNVLMMLGKSMEKLLTLPRTDYERYKKEHSHLVTEEERTAPEAYEYTTMGDFLMRSQLDAHDTRLPGTGMFDLKTRAVVSVRMNSSDYEPMTGYEIQTLQGRFQSYEREYYDMMRSTMLKYMLQVRMGRMDGIFLAYHNVERIFGFQYVPLHEMDRAIHSQTDRCLGDQEFKLSLDLLNKVLDKATAKFPDSSLRLHFETTEEKIRNGTPTTMMWVYAEPMSEDEIGRIQSGSYERTAAFERTMMGIDRDESVDVVNESSVEDKVHESEDTDPGRLQAELAVLPDSDTSSTTTTEATPTVEDAEYLSTATDAAPTFTGTLETRVQRELQPLFAASIVCKSRVNESALPRPEKLGPNDKWELEYLLQEWNTSELTWARYEDLKSRRKAIFDKLRNEDEAENAGDEEGVDKKKRGYIDFLKSMSQQGRVFRDRMNELEAGKEPVVVGQPFGKEEDSVGIEGLDDYLGWLYRTEASKAHEA